ncbi:hypothetical protein DPMN_017322 [Dreissena polymorpha]|uniref:Uncharacterized protein n=1 Tax=Dreissena polymorpha TaxID=45954 RepID=A0A9D4NB59_DREPO|nr:hypothetical protein DPMN_017322 [Dreissena polymorpha]
MSTLARARLSRNSTSWPSRTPTEYRQTTEAGLVWVRHRERLLFNMLQNALDKSRHRCHQNESRMETLKE